MKLVYYMNLVFVYYKYKFILGGLKVDKGILGKVSLTTPGLPCHYNSTNVPC